MKKITRRRFVHQTAKTAIGAALVAATITNNTKAMSSNKNPFIHHVYFWLNKADSKEDLAKLVEGLKKLSAVKTIKVSYIGKPADTNREVIDSSYNISWLCFFDSRADQDSYQVDPIHLDFVKQCQHLWKKVIVYDTVGI